MRILLIEDDKRIRENIVKILKSNAFAVDSAIQGNDGLTKAQDEQYDAIILDWMLPDIDGIEVCRKLRVDGITTPICMLTAKSDLDNKIEGFRNGIDDYLTKPFHMEELIARIKAITRRVGTTPNPVIKIADLEIDTNSCRVTRNKKEICLSPKEYALLEYLARFEGKTIDRVELLTHIWDENADMFSNTVDVHIRYLRLKIDKGYKVKLIKTVKGKGYGLYV